MINRDSEPAQVFMGFRQELQSARDKLGTLCKKKGMEFGMLYNFVIACCDIKVQSQIVSFWMNRENGIREVNSGRTSKKRV